MQITTESALRPAAAAGRQAQSVGTDFQTFLTMLTTQLRNQDPLNPMEATDFAVQLATFAGVEQQTRTNGLLESIAGAIGVNSLSRYTGWIGMEARIPGAVAFSGAPLTLDIEPAPGADSAFLIVTDASGRVVSREPVPLEPGSIDWAGSGPGGLPLPAGRYAFALESRAGDTILRNEPVSVYLPVREARLRPDGTAEIVLQGGVSVSATEITALRQPAA